MTRRGACACGSCARGAAAQRGDRHAAAAARAVYVRSWRLGWAGDTRGIPRRAGKRRVRQRSVQLPRALRGTRGQHTAAVAALAAGRGADGPTAQSSRLAGKEAHPSGCCCAHGAAVARAFGAVVFIHYGRLRQLVAAAALIQRGLGCRPVLGYRAKIRPGTLAPHISCSHDSRLKQEPSPASLHIFLSRRCLASHRQWLPRAARAAKPSKCRSSPARCAATRTRSTTCCWPPPRWCPRSCTRTCARRRRSRLSTPW